MVRTQEPIRRIRRRPAWGAPLACLLGLLPALLGAPGCHGAGVGPSSGTGPGAGPVAALEAPSDLLVAVRTRARAHDRGGALALLDPGRAIHAQEPERAWLLVALWLDLGARRRAAEAAATLPEGTLRTALLAFTAETAVEGLTWLGDGPGPDGWSALVRAFLHAARGDVRPARQAAADAWQRGPLLVRIDAALLEASLALRDGDAAGAQRATDRALQIAPWDARTHQQAGVLARRTGDDEAALRHLLAALQRAPRSETLARELEDAWRAAPEGSARREVGDAALALEGSARGNGAWHALAGLVLLEQQAAPERAQEHLQAALVLGALPVPCERDLRRAYMAQGRHGEAVALLEAAVPPGMLAAPENLMGPVWAALADAVRAAPDRHAPAPARLHLARALTAVGAHGDALEVLRHLAGEEAAALRRRLEGQRAFEQALGRFLGAGYVDATLEREPPDLDALLAAVPSLARRHLVPDEAARLADVRGSVQRFPLVGAWVDHGVRSGNPLVRHFRSYGRYLVLGQRDGAPVEAVLLSMAYLAEKPVVRTTGFEHRHDVAIGLDRGFGTAIVAEGGELGGACLLDGLWLDADSARTSDAGWRRALLRDPATLVAAQQPVPPADSAEGLIDLDDPAGVAARLCDRVRRQRPHDPWSSWYTLLAHESGHVTDLRTYLPLHKGLPATLRLLVRAGGRPHDVERQLERQAQLAAVVDARDPALAVAEMVVMLPVAERDPEVHRGGYRDGLDAMLRHIARHPAAYPAVDATLRLLPQLDRLDDAALRRAAYNAWCAGR